MPFLLDKPHCAICVYIGSPSFSRFRSSSPFFRSLAVRPSMANIATMPWFVVKPLVSLPARPSFPVLAARSSLARVDHSSYSGCNGDPLVEAAVDGKVPAAYVWPAADWRRPLESVPASPPDISVVDLQGGIESPCSISNMPSVMESIASACEKDGIFYIVNHGVPALLVERVRERVCELFSLPPDRKMRALRQEGQYAGFGKAIIGKFFDSLLWSEGFTMIGSPNSCIDHLTDKLFPDGDNEFRRAFEEYDIALRKLAADLVRAILVGVNVRLNQFEYSHFNPQDCHGVLQLNHYPPCPEPRKTMGLPAHTDSTCLTILYQDNVDGLETFRNGQWTVVPPLRHSFVVNIGDMLQIISNGRYKSNLHRAVVNRSTTRHSVAYLCGPPPSALITPAPEVVDSQSQPLYKPLTWTEYLQAKGKHSMGALEHFTYPSTQDRVATFTPAPCSLEIRQR